jgi:hypothetical protein
VRATSPRITCVSPDRIRVGLDERYSSTYLLQVVSTYRPGESTAGSGPTTGIRVNNNISLTLLSPPPRLADLGGSPRHLLLPRKFFLAMARGQWMQENRPCHGARGQRQANVCKIFISVRRFLASEQVLALVPKYLALACTGLNSQSVLQWSLFGTQSL